MPVLVCFGDDRQEVDTSVELDEVLDAVEAAGEPVLVELVGDGAVVNLGIGLPEAAVVLWRDATGTPWSARSRRPPVAAADVELGFAKEGTTYRFFPQAAVQPTEMREIAREFVRSPGSRPTTVDWVAEGAGDDGSGPRGS